MKHASEEGTHGLKDNQNEFQKAKAVCTHVFQIDQCINKLKIKSRYAN